jgi:alkylation response protein AidB-like acyl-CoA dehydrogenase
VDFRLTADQLDARDALRKLCAARMSISAIRATEGRGLDRDAWRELADFGIFSRLAAGDAAVLFEELGRALVPGPLVWTHLAASLDTGLGDVVGGVVGRHPVVVEHLGDLDVLAVVDGDGVSAIDPKDVAGRRLEEPLDPLTPVWAVDALPRGDRIGGPEVAARWTLRGSALTAALLAGIAGALTDLTVGYTRERRQFGRPVGSFQSVKHLLADMLVRSELARAQTYAAALHIDETELAGVQRSVSSAKSVAGRAAVDNGHASMQAHGGMGYTWEVDTHLYLKRAWVLDSAFGSADDHADAVAATLEDGGI